MPVPTNVKKVIFIKKGMNAMSLVSIYRYLPEEERILNADEYADFFVQTRMVARINDTLCYLDDQGTWSAVGMDNIVLRYNPFILEQIKSIIKTVFDHTCLLEFFVKADSCKAEFFND